MKDLSTKNFRLRILLERTPLSEPDKHNISTIFSALSIERQISILDNWDHYIVKMIAVRAEIDVENEEELVRTLGRIDTLLDEALIRQKEKDAYKEQRKQETRAELESTVAYGQMQKLKRIKEVSKIPN